MHICISPDIHYVYYDIHMILYITLYILHTILYIIFYITSYTNSEWSRVHY